ncbi:bromodomain-containing protein 3 [Drosophila subpulchrella]|uniref:bromodomain-containing protein 3 n=1 Tax=Drosophila subpulchrella TaxID=1486046 RepID=UPI0018A17733|nr:bromodomain-containing protein 3 [Drosophila subpulchrella]
MDPSWLQKPRPPPRYEPEIQPVNGIVQPPVNPPPNRPGRKTNVMEDLKSLVNWLCRNRLSVYFRDPVDTLALNVPDYHKTIKHPMDLNTIKKRLNNNYYWQADEALQDLKLIFDNCLFFNSENSDVYQAGKQLKNQFYTRLAMIDQSNEFELPPKMEKRKRKAADTFDSVPAPSVFAPRGPSHFPPHSNRNRNCPNPKPGVTHPEVPIPSYLATNLIPKFMPDNLDNPLSARLTFPPTFKNFYETPMGSHFKRPADVRDSPQPVLRPIVLPPPLTTARLEPIMKGPSPPPVQRQTLPPKPKPPVIICYKSVDRLIEKSHCDHLLKSMVKRKRKQFTWAFNNADYWKKYSLNPDYKHDTEEKLDWKVLQNRLDNDDFESLESFASSVRKMFRNALRCFPEDGLAKMSVKKSMEIFEGRLLKYRELAATAKEKARALVAIKQEDMEIAEAKSGQSTEKGLGKRTGSIKMQPLYDESD